MSRIATIVGVVVLGLLEASGAEAPGPSPADFKLVAATYGLRKEPVETAEVIVHQGRAYRFLSGPSLEVVIHDPEAARLELVDLDRKLRTEVSLKKLDAFQARLHDAIARANARREAEGGRANRLAVAMSRDLIEPKFESQYDPAVHRLRLVTPTIEIEAEGTPESDRPRRELIATTLAALEKLGALRDPRAIPSPPRLEAFRGLEANHLRPTEIRLLYRLAGPPTKVRLTYRLEAALTARELEALARVNTMMDRCRFIRYEQYDQGGTTGRER